MLLLLINVVIIFRFHCNLILVLLHFLLVQIFPNNNAITDPTPISHFGFKSHSSSPGQQFLTPHSLVLGANHVVFDNGERVQRVRLVRAEEYSPTFSLPSLFVVGIVVAVEIVRGGVFPVSPLYNALVHLLGVDLVLGIVV